MENVKNCAVLQFVILKFNFQPEKNGKNPVFLYILAKKGLKSFQQAVENFVENFTVCKQGQQ